MAATVAEIGREDPREGWSVATWLVSLGVHGVLLALFVTSSMTWLKPPGNTSLDEERFHSVGVVVKPRPDASQLDVDSADEDDAREGEANDGGTNEARSVAEAGGGSGVPDRPPVPTALPSRSPSVGPAALAAVRSAAPGSVEDLVKPGDVLSAGGIASLPVGATRFFGIQDEGSRIVYLIDNSGSMSGAKSSWARAQLLASLESLTSRQQFQVLLFNEVVLPMTLPDASRRTGTRKRGVYFATSVNKTLTRSYLNGVRPNDGTRCKEALLAALAYTPDVIYFLTDDESSMLVKAQRVEVAQANEGNTRIHCIEFGDGSPPDVRTPLKELATENGGVYRYVRTRSGT